VYVLCAFNFVIYLASLERQVTFFGFFGKRGENVVTGLWAILLITRRHCLVSCLLV
jgi:hypothetical protein